MNTVQGYDGTIICCRIIVCSYRALTVTDQLKVICQIWESIEVKES